MSTRAGASLWLLLVSTALYGCGGSSPTHSSTTSTAIATVTTSSVTRVSATHRPKPRPRPAHAPFAVGERIVTFVDQSRTIHLPGGSAQPRTLVTIVRYPARGGRVGSTSLTDVRDAPPIRSAGTFPLIVFGHGFAVTPTPYAPLLQAWARAGYVVAAPIFPLENENAPGGPNEADLVNQPRDMSVVITRMLEASDRVHGFFSGLLDPGRIAVSGQSDGGETALAVAYDRFYIDRRVRAAVILSGAEIPGVGGFDFPAPSPPLLATQGTADTINPPSFTYTFFNIAPPPKYLLTMFGAPHLPPYTGEQPQLGIVERVTIAFMDRYVKDERRALPRMLKEGNIPGVSAIQADQ